MRPWYMEAHIEYLIRELSDEFFIEVADVPYPPYENFLDRFPDTSPFQRSPDDYDLVWPILSTHWGITEKDKYRKKTCLVWYQPNEGNYFDDLAGIAAATPFAKKSLEGKPHHDVFFGVDTNLFQPYGMVREDDLFHVGMVGTLLNPRRITPYMVDALKDVSGIRLMLFPNMTPRTQKELNEIGGRLDMIISGDKFWPGLPNIYNQLDVLIRPDSDPGYSFPVLEAMACGVPFISTDSGIDRQLADSGAGFLIEGDRASYQADLKGLAEKVRRKVIYLRDNIVPRRQMGIAGRREVLENWTWDRAIPLWREFFRSSLQNAKNSFS